jgi:hypothetical protein
MVGNSFRIARLTHWAIETGAKEVVEEKLAAEFGEGFRILAER